MILPTIAITLLFVMMVGCIQAATTPPGVIPGPLFTDHMVLQRDKPNRIWGWSEPGSTIRVLLEDESASTVTGPDGRWQLKIKPPSVGGPYRMTIEGPTTVELNDLLVGDVWLCGGQSNMAIGLLETDDGPEEAARADHPGLRLFRVSNQVGYKPLETVEGKWAVCTPEVFSGDFGGFSAVGYYFGRRIQGETGVPIGLIQDCVGGPPVESWMAPETLARMPDYAAQLDAIARLRNSDEPVYGSFLMHWLDQFDAGEAGSTWAAIDHHDETWKEVTLADGFSQLGVPDAPAVCWFRKEVDLPDPLPEGAARIFLGVIEKMDTTSINGQWVGASSWVENPRFYTIGPEVLRPGRNVLAVRVFKMEPDGGFRSPPESLRLILGDETIIPLDGTWKGAVSVDARPPHPLPLGLENYPTMPSVLYQGMIRPVAPLSIKGAIWYQGEANHREAEKYQRLLTAMIADWRRLFDQGDFPFMIVSLPAFMPRRSEPGSDRWTELREAQIMTAQSVPNCDLVVTIDTGEADNIHPTEKRPVGERTARCALHRVYGQDVVSSGPTYASLERLPGALQIHFSDTDGGLVVRGDRLGEFSVAGTDRVWHWAEARIVGDSVLVSSTAVADPIAVRYAWQANPLATLYNGAGLPAVPFRSDDWP